MCRDVWGDFESVKCLLLESFTPSTVRLLVSNLQRENWGVRLGNGVQLCLSGRSKRLGVLASGPRKDTDPSMGHRP